MPESVSVFISYAHEEGNAAHGERVLELADTLRGNGVEAIIDQYDTAPAEGWPLWMERQLRNADYVLMVCTETYHQRVSGQEEGGKGLGAQWEGRLIYNQLYHDGVINNKFIPILFDRIDARFIPAPAQSATRYVLPGEYEYLYRRLTQQSYIVKPELGIPLILPHRGETTPDKAASKAVPFILRDIYTYPEDLHYPPRNGPQWPAHLLTSPAVAMSFSIASSSNNPLRIQSVFLRVLEASRLRRSTFPAYELGGNGAEAIISWVEIKPQEGMYRVEAERRSKVGSGLEPADFHVRVFCQEGFNYRVSVEVDWLDLMQQENSGHYAFSEIISIGVPSMENWRQSVQGARQVRAFYDENSKMLGEDLEAFDKPPLYTIIAKSVVPYGPSGSSPNIYLIPNEKNVLLDDLARLVGAINENGQVCNFLIVDTDVILLQTTQQETADVVEDAELLATAIAAFDALVADIKHQP